MKEIYNCPSCGTKFYDLEDRYCRNCGSERQELNVCKSCYHICRLTDLFCPKCGGETTTYDLQKRE